MVVVSKEMIGGLFVSYSDMVYRIALNIVRNREEAQDIVMDVFMALMKQSSFNDEGHIKAWLIRTRGKMGHGGRSFRVLHTQVGGI